MRPEPQANYLHVTLSISQYAVRSMRKSDIDAVVAIDRMVFPKDGWPMSAFHDAVEDPDYNCWTIENLNSTGPSVLGYGLQYSMDRRTHITSFAIHPLRHGCGLGGILLSRMIQHSSLAGDTMVDLEVSVANERAYRLYVRHGFRITRVQPQYYQDGTDAYEMRLLL